ncbi:hypothetical protein [Sphingomonas sp.]|uniref:hypothetical protein n=1 Tax=Sphingomonas sp. TaxID=28214 RepID=UPI003B00247C
MIASPPTHNEADRLSAMQQYDLVGSDVDLSLDTVVTLARNLFQVPSHWQSSSAPIAEGWRA